MKVKSDLLKAINQYQGPITKCPDGSVAGAGDLGVWAQRRAVGAFGVPEEEILVWQKRQAGKRRRAYKRYLGSSAQFKVGFKKWKGKPKNF